MRRQRASGVIYKSQDDLQPALRAVVYPLVGETLKYIMLLGLPAEVTIDVRNVPSKPHNPAIHGCCTGFLLGIKIVLGDNAVTYTRDFLCLVMLMRSQAVR